MHLEDIQCEVVSHFFSQDLKRYIEENEYVFTGEELLSLADHFAPSFQEKLRLAGRIAASSDAAAMHAQAYVRNKTNLLDAFMHAGKNEVYELTIQDTPEAYPERYLCSTFETALRVIDQFYETYADKPGSGARYTVDKRKILSQDDEFTEDTLGGCLLTRQKLIHTLFCGMDWENEDSYLPLPEFPAFLPGVTPVKYRANSGAVRYGIYVDIEHAPTESCFVIPYESEMLKTLDFKKWWPVCGHEHVPCPDVESVPLGALPEAMQEAYFAFVAWWEEFTGKNQ